MTIEKLMNYMKTKKPEEINEELQQLKRRKEYVIPADKKNLFKKTNLIIEDGTPVVQTPEQQKFEKIEKIFEKIVVETLLFDNQLEKWTTESFDETWSLAERFYEFVKKKQEETENADML